MVSDGYGYDLKMVGLLLQMIKIAKNHWFVTING